MIDGCLIPINNLFKYFLCVSFSSAVYLPVFITKLQYRMYVCVYIQSIHCLLNQISEFRETESKSIKISVKGSTWTKLKNFCITQQAFPEKKKSSVDKNNWWHKVFIWHGWFLWCRMIRSRYFIYSIQFVSNIQSLGFLKQNEKKKKRYEAAWSRNCRRYFWFVQSV